MNHKDTVDKQLVDALQTFLPQHFERRRRLRTMLTTSPSPSHPEEYTIPTIGRDVASVVEELSTDILVHGARTEHPRFYGFIPGPASIASWVGDSLSTAANLHGAAIANAPKAIAAERATLEWLAWKVGYGPQAGGDFVSGGSIANLTALTTARDNQLDPTDWSRAVAYLSVEAHSSLMRALRIIGISDDRIRLIGVDENFRMLPDELYATIAADRRAGYAPFAVVATAGTTNTGTIDPLAEIATITGAEGLWLHVDAAFGASVLLSDKHRDLLHGVEHAESISWDAHKWMFQTYGLGILLVREKTTLVRSFSVEPEYLEDVQADGHTHNPSDLSIELTRPTRGLRLWFSLQVYGSKQIGAWIDSGIEAAETFQNIISTRSDWEIVSHASLAIVTFRYAPDAVPEQVHDELNSEISRRILAEGFAAIYTTTLRGQKVLRLAATNPATTPQDLAETAARLDKHARAVLAEMVKGSSSESEVVTHYA